MTNSRTLVQFSELINAKTNVIKYYQRMIKVSDERVQKIEEIFMNRLVELILYQGVVKSGVHVHPNDLHNQVESEKAERYKWITALNSSIEEHMDYCNEFLQLVASKNLDSFEHTTAPETPHFIGGLRNPYAVDETYC